MIENEDGNDGSVVFGNYVEGFSNSTCFCFSAKSTDGYLPETIYDRMVKESEESVEPDSMQGWEGYDALYDQVTIPQADAQSQGQKVLNDLKITDMALMSASRLVSGKYPDKGGYELVYMRQCGGITGYLLESSGWYDEEAPPQYSPPFTMETITIRVTDDGILSFDWNGCASVIETVNENVALLPFDQIQQDLKDQMFYKKSFDAMITDGYGQSDFKVTVTSAELRMGYIGVKDHANQALLVPVWVFETEYSDFNSVLGREQGYTDDSYVLSAVDGGVIEVRY